MKAFFQSKWILLAAVTLVSVLVYLAICVLTFRTGFPLDDAWIHQTYARNLATHFEWAFLPGQPSGGATSPLWVILLVPGYWIGLPPLVWSGILGFGMLLGISAFAQIAHSQYVGRLEEQAENNGRRSGWRASVPWMGLFVCLEWHLVWAALSGMETLLFSGVICLVLVLLWQKKPGWLSIGLLCGLSTWIRPDGLTLLGPALLLSILQPEDWKQRLRGFSLTIVGFFALFIPYLGFNQAVNGSFWPTTLHAKQAEYAILRMRPFLDRYIDELMLPLVGAGILLLPGWIFLAVRGIRLKEAGLLAGMVWWLGYLGIFAARLPVTYQHGRYAIPAVAIFALWGLTGLTLAIRTLRGGRAAILLSRAWPVTIGIVLVVFWLLGGRAYANDVAIIESEMVETAHWLAGNTPPDSVIAAHDIGAIGFYGNRAILDLAGLISPEVIPFIRDETRIANFLESNRADYLVTFPGWYPDLVKGRVHLYKSNALFAPQLGGENMAVFPWRPP